MSSKDILQKANLRSTPIRRCILELCLQEKRALSQRDIEQTIANNYNRTTIYRTLKLFKDEGILHEVIDDKFTVKYALCPANSLTKDHAHFKCLECSQTYCLQAIVPIKETSVGEGFEVLGQKTLLLGRCKNCKQGNV